MVRVFVRFDASRESGVGARDASRTSDRDEPLRPLLWLETLMSLAVTAPYRRRGLFLLAPDAASGGMCLVWRDLARGARSVVSVHPAPTTLSRGALTR